MSQNIISHDYYYNKERENTSNLIKSNLHNNTNTKNCSYGQNMNECNNGVAKDGNKSIFYINKNKKKVNKMRNVNTNKYSNIKEEIFNIDNYISINDDDENVIIEDKILNKGNKKNSIGNNNDNGDNNSCSNNNNNINNMSINRNKRKKWIGRTFSPFTPGGVRYSIFLFINTVIGVGFISIPYVFSNIGIVLAFILILLNTLESYVTTNILCCSSLEHNIYTYGNLLKKIGNNYYKIIIDIGLTASYISSYILVLISINNFLSDIFNILKFQKFFCNKIFIIVAVCLLSLPLTFRNQIGRLKYFMNFSIISLLITLMVIGAQSQHSYNSLIDKNILFFKMDLNFFKCFNILLFSYSQQSNACFILGQFIQPTQKRITKLTYRSVLLQTIFYTLFGFFGYISFLSITKDNILLNYEENNICILVCKFLLSINFFFSIPLNFMGSYQSILFLFKATFNFFYKIYSFIFRESISNVSLSSALQDNSIDPLEITSDTLLQTPTIHESQTEDKKQKILVSTLVTIVCGIIACNVEMLSNVIVIGGGISNTLISCILPNIIYFKDRKKTKNKTKRYLTLLLTFFFSFMSLISIFFTALSVVFQ